MKNSLVTGLLVGAIFPILAYVLQTYTQLQQELMPTKPTGFYVLAATVNLVTAWITYKKGWDKFATGLILATFLGMLALVFTKNIAI
ncbi:hypothetical protein [Sphingobacterium humi]|uniref:Uncharacterized protein n=1 Tax=Sphingobacterium humi TaxID=1796905 RepID=A0A6N8L249_9SPHI|nr:hypothetical protein [Sphingobacterium humi]MVZ63164.1 hypothetical protein [Sphingobacterium humi]